MSLNSELAARFSDMAMALELLGANRFRVNAYQRVARLVKDATRDFGAIVEDDPETALQRLQALDGVGKATAEKIVEFVADGAIAEHVELLEKVPAGLFEVLQIPGVGPKAAKAMWTELGIESLDDLKGTSDDDLAALPRMGKKTVENIRQATRFAEAAGERVPIGRARPIALAIVERLREVSSVERAEFAGSLRRGRETIGDLDFLVACSDVKAVRETFVEMPEVTQVLVSGDTKTSVRLRSGDGPKAVHVQADLRIVPIAAWGAALMYFTGSKEHNVRLRELAIQRGQRLNEYGLWQGTDERPQDAEGAEPVAAGSEEEIYRALDLPWIPPELREDRGELAWARSDARGELIRLDDVRAELHAHTTASDGRLSILELAQEAKRRGFHTIAVTDHSKSQPIAGGLSDERLVEHIEAVHAADREIDGITILAGSEVDILADGSLDYDDELLARLDVVVASPHVALRQDPDAATERLLRAVRHPLVHILGHPTGRIVQRREGLAPDLDALVAAAAEHDVALELNANWNRLDLRDTHLRLALDAGCKIAIDTDAHDVPHFDFLIYGILTARRAGLPADACINTWSAERLHGWLRSKR